MTISGKTVLGYACVFVAGFSLCALILKVSGAIGDRAPGAALPGGKTALARALATPPVRGGNPRGALPSLADAAAKVEPAVVNIDISGIDYSGVPGRFRGDSPGSRAQPVEGSGSGILLSPDGYILTNHHVIAPAGNDGDIQVTLADGRRFRVIVIGRDPMSDLAVLKIPGGRDLPSAILGNSDSVRVGDWAVAVGNPLGFNSTVTLGIISAVDRDYRRRDNAALDKVLQTDASINPGNSGGALADIEGRVIGVNTAIASSTGASVGIGFAIPINQARQIASQLIASGAVTRPYLGITYAPLDAVERSALPDGVSLPPDNLGAAILPPPDGIAPGSPAQKAGLLPWDVIRAIDDIPVKSDDDIKNAVASHNVGATLRLSIWRAGQQLLIPVILETMPESYGVR